MTEMYCERRSCPACKGAGEQIRIDWPLAIFTFGMTALLDLAFPERCKPCRGKGWLEVWIRNERAA
jgi:hypothetical protein